MKPRSKKIIKTVHGTNNPIYEEFLPYPYVYYSDIYGTFIGFAKHKDGSTVYLCNCARRAFDNYLKIRQLDDDNFNNTDPPTKYSFR